VKLFIQFLDVLKLIGNVPEFLFCIPDATFDLLYSGNYIEITLNLPDNEKNIDN